MLLPCRGLGAGLYKAAVHGAGGTGSGAQAVMHEKLRSPGPPFSRLLIVHGPVWSAGVGAEYKVESTDMHSALFVLAGRGRRAGGGGSSSLGWQDLETTWSRNIPGPLSQCCAGQPNQEQSRRWAGRAAGEEAWASGPWKPCVQETSLEPLPHPQATGTVLRGLCLARHTKGQWLEGEGSLQ